VSSTGNVTILNQPGAGASTDVIVEVEGWITDGTDPGASGGLYNGNNGTRVCDTRTGNNQINPQCQGMTLGAGTNSNTLSVQISGMGGVPQPGPGVTAVEVALTALNTTSTTNIVVYPSDGTPPNCANPQTSDLYLSAGSIVMNTDVILPIGQDGFINVTNCQGQADVTIDVLGYYTQSSGVYNGPNGGACPQATPPKCSEAYDFAYPDGLDTRYAASTMSGIVNSPTMPTNYFWDNYSAGWAVGHLNRDTFYSFDGHAQMFQYNGYPEWNAMYHYSNGRTSYIAGTPGDCAAAPSMGAAPTYCPQGMPTNHSLAVLVGCGTGITGNDRSNPAAGFFNAGATVSIGFTCTLYQQNYGPFWTQAFWTCFRGGGSVGACMATAQNKVKIQTGGFGGYDQWQSYGDTTMTDAWR
jgi:hypothetical protein